MRKILFTVISFTFLSLLHAQVLYSTAFSGGANGGGTISKLDVATKTLTAAFSFDAPDLSSPDLISLVQATNGKIYGITCTGGSHNVGGLFSFDPATGNYIKLKDF